LFQKTLKIAAVAFVLYAFVGFLLLPLFLKPQLITVVKNSTYTTMTIEHLYCNPFSFEIELHKVKLLNKQHKKVVAFEKLLLNYDPSALLFGVIQLQNISIERPFVSILYTKNKKINLLSLIKQSESGERQSQESQLARIVIERIAISNGSVAFKDFTQSETFEFDFENIDFTLSDIDTKDIKRSNVSLELKTQLKSGGTIEWKTSLVSLNPLISKGSVALNLDNLSTLWKYVKQDFPYEVTQGNLLFSSEYQLNLNELNATVIKDVVLRVDDIHLRDKKSKEKIFSLKTFDLVGGRIEPLSLDIDLNKVTLDRLSLNVQRQKNKSINLQNYFLSQNDEHNRSEKKSTRLKFHLGEFKLTQSDIKFRDDSLASTMLLSIDKLNCSIENITTAKSEVGQYNLKMNINQDGRFYTEGSFSLSSEEQKGVFHLKNLSLKPYNPYLQESTWMAIQDGLLSLKGKSEYKNKIFKVGSDLELENLRIDETKGNRELVRVKHMALNAIELKQEKLSIKRIVVEKFHLNSRMDKHGFSLLNLIKKSQKSEKKDGKFIYAIKRVEIKDAQCRFTDRTLKKPFKVVLHNIDATVKNLTNKKGKYTVVKVKNEIDKYASARIDATISSYDPGIDSRLKVTVQRYNLHSLSPYSYTYAGEKITSGELYLNLNYTTTHEKLKGTNNIVLKNSVLGEKSKEKDAPDVPLDAALLLLEDSDGVVDIDVSIDGDLSEPGFAYSSLFTKIISDTVTKVIYSPFTFIGKSLGMNSEELEYISFEFGKSIISDEEQQELKKVAKIIREKKNLSIEFAGVYDPKKDIVVTQGSNKDKETLEQLAEARAKNVKNFLLNEGVLEHQIIILKDKKVDTGSDKTIKEYIHIVIK